MVSGSTKRSSARPSPEVAGSELRSFILSFAIQSEICATVKDSPWNVVPKKLEESLPLRRLGGGFFMQLDGVFKESVDARKLQGTTHNHPPIFIPSEWR